MSDHQANHSVARMCRLLEVSASGYESDKVAFADVIASYTLWLDTNLALADKRRAYGTGLAELEQAVGQSFTQRREE